MADNFAGMFRDPRSYRDERLNQMMQQRQAISNMGGSMSQLLGQVAAGGGATGAMMAEGLGGMFGMQTREEAQAAKLQDMASKIDMNEPEDLNQFAMALNSLGMTKEAVQVLEKRQSVINQINANNDRQRAIAKAEKEGAMKPTRTYKKTITRPMQVGSGKDAQIVNVPMQVDVTEEGTYDPVTKTWSWRIIGGKEGGTGTASLYGGITVIDPKTGMATMTEGDPAVDGFEEDLTISP